MRWYPGVEGYVASPMQREISAWWGDGGRGGVPPHHEGEKEGQKGEREREREIDENGVHRYYEGKRGERKRREETERKVASI